MNFIKGIKNFDILNTIYQITNKNNQQIASKSALNEIRIQTELDVEPSIEQSFEFIESLRKSIQVIQKQKNNIKRKINIFENLQVDPLYLQNNYEKKFIEFELQLNHHSIQGHLHRVQQLYAQFRQVQQAIQNVLFKREVSLIDLFQIVDEYDIRSLNALSKINGLKKHSTKLSLVSKNKIIELQTRKNIIKSKIKLIRNLKIKYQTSAIRIQNIDQAFFTERSRIKLYKELIKNKDNKCIAIKFMTFKLVRIAQICRLIVQQQLFEWIKGSLEAKQIQKLAILIYFIETEDIYRNNQLGIDYNQFDKSVLKLRLEQLKEWKDFKYIQDPSMKGRISDFLSYLIHKIQ